MYCLYISKRRGSTIIEYVLLTSLIVGTMWCATCVFHEFNHASMGPLNSHLSGGPGYVAVSTKAVPIPIRGKEAPDLDDDFAGANIWGVPLAMAAIAMGGIYYSHRRVRKSNKMSPDEHGEQRHDDEPIEAHHDRLFEKRQQILQVINNDIYALLEGRLKVRHLMTTDLTTVKETSTVDEVKELMEKNKMRHMLVCNNAGELCGVVSDRDLVKTEAKLIRAVMTRNTFTIDAESQVSPAATLMIDRRISMLPVTDQGKLCGVITTTDLVMSLQSGLQVLLKISVDAGTRASDRK
jgi:CBS domain-containing protein